MITLFTLPGDASSQIWGIVSGLFESFKSLIFLVLGVLLGFFILQKLIDLTYFLVVRRREAKERAREERREAKERAREEMKARYYFREREIKRYRGIKTPKISKVIDILPPKK